MHMEGEQISTPISRPRGKKPLKAKSRYDLRSYQMQKGLGSLQAPLDTCMGTP